MLINQPGLRAVNLQKARLLERLHNRNPGLASEIRAMKLDWYTVRNAAEEDNGRAEVFIYDEIGGSFGVSALDFVEELDAITAPEIVVRLNSPGGLLMDGITIASAIAQHPSKIITRVDGLAASAASIVAVAGDQVEMMAGSQMMIHDASVTVSGNPREVRDLLDWLEAQSENIAEFYARKAGGTSASWRERMQAETWMFAEEAVNVGLADALYTSTKKFTSSDDGSPSVADEVMNAEDKISAKIEALMNKNHRLTNRGYKYLGRDKAPAPMNRFNPVGESAPEPIENNGFADLLNAWR